MYFVAQLILLSIKIGKKWLFDLAFMRKDFFFLCKLCLIGKFVLFSVEKKHVKQGNVLIETVLNGGPLYFRSVIWGLYLRSRGPEVSRIRLNHAFLDDCVYWWNDFFFKITPSDYIVVSGPKMGLFSEKGNFRNSSKILKCWVKVVLLNRYFQMKIMFKIIWLSFLCRKLTGNLFLMDCR